ncbi:MAG TPA: NADH-quinone oxidoreductase subunit B [Candidatus Caldiarchaeum subterraneum]|uniref:NADH-quinone oxidoreductase subunit B n=1 Tax=Caldiarchaeum subterraneum TaxID=311458 RepID=A0A833E940_CALS0|nr:NADH-quinone oxidoreductase subunit B [Candidatus Caldarchaeum subterraneum]
MVEETPVPKKNIGKVIRQYGLEKVHKEQAGNGVNYFLYKFRNFVLVRYLVNWGRMASLFPVHLTTACCSVEFAATHSPRYDPERFGWLPATGSLRQSDVIVVEGTVTTKMAQRLRLIYDQMPEPKWVIAMGACAISGGLYAKDSYNVIQGIDDIVPVDVYVPGCPPRPETLFQGILLLREKILYGKTA